MGYGSAAKIVLLLFFANQKCDAGSPDRLIISNILTSSQPLQTSSNAVNSSPGVQLQQLFLDYDQSNLPIQNLNLMLQNHHNEEGCSLSTGKVSAMDIDTSVSLSTGSIIPQSLGLGAFTPVHISSQNSVSSVSSTPTSSSSSNSFSKSQAMIKSSFPSTSKTSNIPVPQNKGHCITDVPILDYSKKNINPEFIISDVSNNVQDILSSLTVCSNSNSPMPQSLNNHMPVISNPPLPVFTIIESNNLAKDAQSLKVSPTHQNVQSTPLVSGPLSNPPIQASIIESNDSHAKNKPPLNILTTCVNVQPAPSSPIISPHCESVSQLPLCDPNLFINSNNFISTFSNDSDLKNNIQNSKSPNSSSLDQCDKLLQSKKKIQLNGKPVPSTTNILTLKPIYNLKPVYPQSISTVPSIPDFVTSLPETFIDPTCSIFTRNPLGDSNMNNPIVSFDNIVKTSLINDNFTENVIKSEIQEPVNLLNTKANYPFLSDCNFNNKLVFPRHIPGTAQRTNIGTTCISSNGVCNSLVESYLPNPNAAYNNIVNISPCNIHLNESPVSPVKFDEILSPTEISQAIKLRNTNPSFIANYFSDYSSDSNTIPPNNIATHIDTKSSIGANFLGSNNIAYNPAVESKTSNPTVSFNNILNTSPCTSNINVNNVKLDKGTETPQKVNIIKSLPQVITSTAPNINAINIPVVQASITNRVDQTQSKVPNANAQNIHVVPGDIATNIAQLPSANLFSVAPNNNFFNENLIVNTLPTTDFNNIVCRSPSKTVTLLNPSQPKLTLNVSPINCAASGIVPVSSNNESDQRLQSKTNTIPAIYVPPCAVTAPSTSSLPIYPVEPISKSYVPSITYLKTQKSSPISDSCSSLVSNLVESILSAVNPQTLLQSVLNSPPPLPASSYPQSTYISSHNLPTYKYYTQPQYIEIETEYYQDFIPNLNSAFSSVMSLDFLDDSSIIVPVCSASPTSRSFTSYPDLNSEDLISLLINDDDESSSNARDLINLLLYNELLGRGCNSFNSMLTFLLANM